MAITLNGTTGITTPDLTSAAPMDVGGSAVLTAASSLAAANLTGALPAISGAALTDLPAGGKVVQVVSQQFSGVETFLQSATYLESTLSLSITPASASNKIFVTILGGMFHGTSSYTRSDVTIYRDSTTNLFSTGTGQNAYLGNGYIPLAMSVLDSPATTSAVNYKVYFKSNSGNVVFGEQSTMATITLMEIAG